MTDLNPTLRVKVNCQRVSALAREAGGAYTMIQRGHCKGLALVSTKKASGYECSPARDLRPSECQRDPLVSSESRRQSGLGTFTLHFPRVRIILDWLPAHIPLTPTKCFGVNARASPGPFVLSEFRKYLTI